MRQSSPQDRFRVRSENHQAASRRSRPMQTLSESRCPDPATAGRPRKPERFAWLRPEPSAAASWRRLLPALRRVRSAAPATQPFARQNMLRRRLRTKPTRAFPALLWPQLPAPETDLKCMGRRRAGTTPASALLRGYPPAAWRAAYRNTVDSLRNQGSRRGKNRNILQPALTALRPPRCGRQNRIPPPAFHATDL